DTVVISHGHPDHYGGLIGLLEQRKAPVNVVLHPNALLSRYAVSPGGDLNGPYLLDKEKVERSGGRLILCENHMMVTDGVLVTGEVSRGCSPEWPGKAERKILKNGIWENDEFSDDQAVVVNLKGKGLVVIGGCMHAGIINTMEHVKKVSGIDRIHAIIGGFHLTGAPEENTITAIENLKKVNPALLIGGHCTGLNTIFKMMQMMPEQFRISCSGTIIDLKA
ncbi:MAG: MBL fold metallo-hydrolase, partial [Dehalococcoidia bacterium]|nr:MBL fold metallo-hydrolase [Dehalococcoidia bacterium]